MLAYNSAENEILQVSPFFANYGFDAALTYDVFNKHPVVLEAKTAAYKL